MIRYLLGLHFHIKKAGYKCLERVFLAGFLLVLFNSTSYASCSALVNEVRTIDIGSLSIQKDVPVGSVIGTYTIPNTNEGLGLCSGSGNQYEEMDSGESLGDNVYATNISGVGIKGQIWGGQYGYITNPPTKQIYSDQTLYDVGGGAVFTLVKTGPITSGTFDSSALVARVYYDTGGNALSFYFSPSSSVTQLSCEIITPKLLFSMGDVDISYFKGAGTNPDVPLKEHQLSMDCDKDANVNITLSATQNPDSTDDSVIQLTGQGDAGVAQGVGVQLMYDSKPLEINKMINLKKSGGGVDVFNIGARYIQTKGTVTPGKANATAVLNVTYQ